MTEREIIYLQKSQRSGETDNYEADSSGWKFLWSLAPVAIFLKFYSLGIMCWDIFYLLLHTGICIMQAALRTVKPVPLKLLKDEVAMIVGSSRGVGREIAFQLAELGVKVVCIDINETVNMTTVSSIKSAGGIAFGFTCDVTKKQYVDETFKSVDALVGDITMLFHCCGVPSPKSLISAPPPLQSTLDVSVISHFHLLENVLPKMRHRRHGHIVFLTSVAGLSGNKHHMPLSVSQFAVQGIFESVTEEIRIRRQQNLIFTTLVHVYPFIISDDLAADIRLRIPSYFGTISATLAAAKIIEGVRRNNMEVSIPGYLLHLGQYLRLLPRRATSMMRELLDTGVDFG